MKYKYVKRCLKYFPPISRNTLENICVSPYMKSLYIPFQCNRIYYNGSMLKFLCVSVYKSYINHFYYMLYRIRIAYINFKTFEKYLWVKVCNFWCTDEGYLHQKHNENSWHTINRYLIYIPNKYTYKQTYIQTNWKLSDGNNINYGISRGKKNSFEFLFLFENRIIYSKVTAE